MRGSVAAAEYGSKLTQRELEALGAWKNPKTGHDVPVSKATLRRVVASLDPERTEAALQRFSMPRPNLGPATVLDVKRIRGANRNGEGHHETATLVDRATGAPLASLAFNDSGDETAAGRALLDDAPVEGRATAIDALHTTRDTARAVKEIHGADYFMTVEGNAPETCETLASIDRERDASGHFEEDVAKARGRIATPDPASGPDRLSSCRADVPCHPQARRRTAQRHRRDRHRARLRHRLGVGGARLAKGPSRLEPRPPASVEVNRRVGDKLFDEDAWLALAGFAPGNDALEHKHRARDRHPHDRLRQPRPGNPPLRDPAPGTPLPRSFPPEPTTPSSPDGRQWRCAASSPPGCRHRRSLRPSQGLARTESRAPASRAIPREPRHSMSPDAASIIRNPGAWDSPGIRACLLPLRGQSGYRRCVGSSGEDCRWAVEFGREATASTVAER